MELDRAERLGSVPDPFVGPVVHVDEPRLPVLSQSLVVYGESVILGCDEAAVGPHHPDRLVVAAVTVFQLLCIRAAGTSQQLVAHAYSENWLVAFHGLPQVRDGYIAELWVSRAV